MADLSDLNNAGPAAIVGALWILREVFSFLRGRNHRAAQKKDVAPTSGEMPKEYWQQELRTGVKDALAPFLAVQTEVLHSIQLSETEIQKGIQELVILAQQAAQREAQREAVRAAMRDKE